MGRSREAKLQGIWVRAICKMQKETQELEKKFYSLKQHARLRLYFLTKVIQIEMGNSKLL